MEYFVNPGAPGDEIVEYGIDIMGRLELSKTAVKYARSHMGLVDHHLHEIYLPDSKSKRFSWCMLELYFVLLK